MINPTYAFAGMQFKTANNLWGCDGGGYLAMSGIPQFGYHRFHAAYSGKFTKEKKKIITWPVLLIQILWLTLFPKRRFTIMPPLTYHNYGVAWICALHLELTAAIAMLDETHAPLERASGDNNIYVLGRVGVHNVAIASLPAGETGTNSAAQVAAHMSRTFQNVKFTLMVGIGGGAPGSKHKPRLGDVVVSKPTYQHGGVVQYDLGRNVPGGFELLGFLNAPPRVLRATMTVLRGWQSIPGEENALSNYLSISTNPKLPQGYQYPGPEHDRLFKAEYIHVRSTTSPCDACDPTYLLPRDDRPCPAIHYGLIASGNQIMQNALVRDEITKKHRILCFEMEAAGLMNELPCLVIRGISDYSDSHKNSQWKNYAAATAAAYAKELLRFIPKERVATTSPIDSRLSPPPPRNAERDERPDQQAETGSPFDSDDDPMPSMVPSTSILMDGSLNWDEVALGRLILNLDDPVQDYYQITPSPVAPEEISVGPYQDIEPTLKSNGGSRLVERFRNLFVPKSNQKTVSITYKLHNSGKFLAQLLANEGVRVWIEEALQGGNYVYLAVAIHSIITIPHANDSSTVARVTERVLTNRGTGPGDRVIGVQYRKLRFRRFNSVGTPSPYLQHGGRWKLYKPQGPRTDGTDSVEVSLEQSFSLDEDANDFNYERLPSVVEDQDLVLLVYLNYCLFTNASCRTSHESGTQPEADGALGSVLLAMSFSQFHLVLFKTISSIALVLPRAGEGEERAVCMENRSNNEVVTRIP